jgi:hypothetical protein
MRSKEDYECKAFSTMFGTQQEPNKCLFISYLPLNRLFSLFQPQFLHWENAHTIPFHRLL